MKGKRKKEITAVCAIILAGNLAGLGIYLEDKQELPEGRLERRDFGEGEYQEKLKVKTEGETREIQITVGEREYSKKQRKSYLDQAEKKLEEWIEGELDPKGRIRKSLEFPSAFSGNPAFLSWSTDDPGLVRWDGSLGEELTWEGGNVRLFCRISLGEEEKTWEKNFFVYPGDLSEDQIFQQEIQKRADMENSPFSKDFFLPQMVEGKRVSYERENQGTGLKLCLFSVLLGLGIFPLRREKERQKKERIQRQLQADYPEILQKLSLLLIAGLSVRKAMERMVLDYKKQREEYGNPVRRAYEELDRACREMEGGIYETQAYERLGRRCEILEYKTLSMLLVQNLKKGNQNLLELLEREAAAAGEERRRRAKIRGEEASTKLLLPMALQLTVVLIILIVPAFMAFL